MIGQILTAPETGWKRIEDTDKRIAYGGSFAQYAPGVAFSSGTYTQGKNMTVSFKFTGTKLRIIGVVSDGFTNKGKLIVDDVQVATINELGALTYQVLVADVQGLTAGEHTAKLICDDNLYLLLDAIELDASADLVDLTSGQSGVKLTATAGDAQVGLAWTALNGVSYTVKRATTAGGPYAMLVTNINDTNYIDKTAVNDTTYYYVVTAIAGSGQTVDSNESSATPKGSSTMENCVLLRIIMSDSSEREYKIEKKEADLFVSWCKRTLNSGEACYQMKDTLDGSAEYLLFEKIISFKVMKIN